MAFCSKCGSEIPEGTAFCPKCGTPVGGAAPVAVVPEWDHTAEFDPKDISDNKVFAMSAYLLGIFGIIVAALLVKDSAYTKFHVRESMKIEVLMALCCLLFIIPILGWIVGGIGICILTVVAIIQFFSVCKGNGKEAPIVRAFSFLK